MTRRSLIFVAVAVLLLFAGSPAKADSISVGAFAFDNIFSGVNSFDVYNLTGDPSLGGYAEPPGFPVYTFLSFDDVTLTLDNADGSTTTESLGEIDPGFPALGTYLVDGSNSYTGATLTGDFSATALTLDDGTTVNIDGSFSSTITPSSGSTLQAGVDFAVINANTEVLPLSEPPSLLLVGIGFLVIAGILRKRITHTHTS